MVTVRYTEKGGWERGLLQPYGPLMLDPSSSVLHYGQAIFEGFKAYSQPDGCVKTFRPFANAQRFARSAERMAMPQLPEEIFVEAADALIREDKAWVPTAFGESLYLRPLMIATDAALGVRPSHEYLFVLFASPAGAYFAGGVKPVTVWISKDYVRAAPGGTGSAKCAGNCRISGLETGQGEGCDQVVWLDAVHRTNVDEMGGMKSFRLQRGRAFGGRDPELTGTLAGHHPPSILELLRAGLGRRRAQDHRG